MALQEAKQMNTPTSEILEVISTNFSSQNRKAK